MAEFIYQMIKARKAIGDKVTLDDVTMSFFPGVKVGMIGPDGVGKSSILKIMAGLDEPNNGEVRLTPGYTVGILMQEPVLDETKTVTENVRLGVTDIFSKPARFDEVSEEMANSDADFDALMKETGKFQIEIDAANAWDTDSQLDQAMDALRRPSSDQPVSVLSGGECRCVTLCKLLIEAPDLLLFDELMNHFDTESVLWLEKHLASYPGAVIVVAHDRYFLDHVAGWIAEVDCDHLCPYEGNYSTYLETKEKHLPVQGQKDTKMVKRLKEGPEWVCSNAKGRQARPKARLARYEEMVAEAERARKLDFEGIQIPPGPHLGSAVIEAKDLRKGFGDRSLINGPPLSLPRNGIVGVTGPNGVGKTTLPKMIVDLESPDGGELTIGEIAKTSCVDQPRAGIDPDKTLWEVVSDGPGFIQIGNVEMPSRAYVSAFGFKGPDQQKSAGVLSGGGRNRLNLALTLKQSGNPLLLDEPTNGPDVEVLDSLENALLALPDCTVVVTHDCRFLDRVVTHILVQEGTEKVPGNWYWFEGDFEAYEKNKVARLSEAAVNPHRVAHRKLTRD